MLSSEDNELLTRVGPGTPMGNLFRRFWLPAVLSRELTADATPVRLRILGEDLVAFRDSNGKVGIVDAYCPHKLAPLYFGRNEECGLRCVYHGWKFDVEGRCTEVPNVPNLRDAATLKAKLGIISYPTREAGSVVWIYMGPADRMPEIPHLEWTQVPAGYQHVSRWLQRSNWAQGMEGEIDTSHISYLHSYLPGVTPPARFPVRRVPVAAADGAPVITLRETDYGYTYGARRNYTNGDFYWRVTQWLVPMYSLIPSAGFPTGGRAWVPVDDNNTIAFGYTYRTDRPFTAEEIAQIEEGLTFPPRNIKGAVELPHGYVIDTFVPLAHKGNDYMLDREMQKKVNYTGILGINEQDRALQECMRTVPGTSGTVDRRHEHLVYSDIPVITARRILANMARDLEKGIEPRQAYDGKLYAVRSIGTLAPEDDFDRFLEVHADEARAQAQRA